MKSGKLLKGIKDEYRVLTSKKYTTVAGTLVYFFIMSVVPFAFWLTLLFGKIIDYDTLLNLKLFSGAEKFISYIIESARSATDGAGIVLIVTTLYSATNLFYHIRRSGEIIYDFGHVGGIRVRLSALVIMLLAVVSIAAVIAVLSAAYYVLAKFIGGIAAESAAYICIIAAAFFFALALNLYICPFKLKIKEALPGTAITTCLWTGAVVAFGIYLHFANVSRLYGAVSVIIVFLLWLYIMMNCFVIGVIFNSARIDRVDREIKKF